MRRPRHRVKSNLLWKMLGLAALANVLLWPIIIRLGAFHGVRQELFPVTLVTRPSALKVPALLPKVPIAIAKTPKSAPVIAKAPPVPAALPAPKPKPILVATAPPAIRPAVVPFIEKQPIPSTAQLAKQSARRRRAAQQRRRTRLELIAKAAKLHNVPKRPAVKIAAVRVPARPAPKPAEHVASKLSVTESKPTQIANSNPPTAPLIDPGTNVAPSATLPPVHRPAVALVKVQPAIPESMQNSAWQALFRGQFLVDKNGHVTPHMVASTGHSILDARALEAAKHWKFRPATRNGVPVASTVKFEIEYAVRDVP